MVVHLQMLPCNPSAAAPLMTCNVLWAYGMSYKRIQLAIDSYLLSHQCLHRLFTHRRSLWQEALANSLHPHPRILFMTPIVRTSAYKSPTDSDCQYPYFSDPSKNSAQPRDEARRLWIPSEHSRRSRTLILCFDGTGDHFDSDVREGQRSYCFRVLTFRDRAEF